MPECSSLPLEALKKAANVLYPYTASNACIRAVARALLEWGAARDAVIAAKDSALRRANALVRGWRVSSLTAESPAGPSFLALADILDAALASAPAAVSERARRERAVVEAGLVCHRDHEDHASRATSELARKNRLTQEAHEGALWDAIAHLAALDTPPAGGA